MPTARTLARVIPIHLLRCLDWLTLTKYTILATGMNDTKSKTNNSQITIHQKWASYTSYPSWAKFNQYANKKDDSTNNNPLGSEHSDQSSTRSYAEGRSWGRVKAPQHYAILRMSLPSANLSAYAFWKPYRTPSSDVRLRTRFNQNGTQSWLNRDSYSQFHQLAPASKPTALQAATCTQTSSDKSQNGSFVSTATQWQLSGTG